MSILNHFRSNNPNKGNNNVSIFLGAVLVLGGITTLFLDPFEFITRQEHMVPYGVIPLSLAMVMGYVLLINSILNKIQNLETAAKYTFLDKIPLKHLHTRRVKLIVIVSSLFFGILGALFISTRETLSDKLVNETWMVEKVIYNNKSYTTATSIENGDKVFYITQESIHFYADGNVDLPAIQTDPIRGKWMLNGNTVMISNASNLDYVYNGSYTVEVEKCRIFLKSDMTIIEGNSLICF